LVLAFGFNFGSRAAFVTMVFCVALELWRERKLGQMRVLVGVTAAGIAVSILIPWVQSNWGYWFPTSASVIQPQTTQPQTTQPQIGAVAKQLSTEGAGTNQARIDSWSDVLRSFTVGTNFIFGGEIGSQDYFLYVCTGERIEAYREGFTAIPGVPWSGQGANARCMIDHGWDAMPVRDPHNWFLNMMLYHGIVGTGIWLFGFGAVLWVTRRVKNGSLAVISIGAYFVCGSFQVIMSASFALLPTAVFLAWLLSRYLLGGENLRPLSPAPQKAVTSSG
jgi:O-antigen ligase